MFPFVHRSMSTAEPSLVHHDFRWGLLVGPPLLEMLHVLMPNIEYKGHHPLKPVATGMIPSKYQRFVGPQSARLIKKIPSAIRKNRSAFPTLVFIKSSFNIRLRLVVSNNNFQGPLFHCTAECLVSFQQILHFEVVRDQFFRLDLP